MKARLIAILLLTTPLSHAQKASYWNVSSKPWNAIIVSPTTPKDSRGETVYETQGETQKDIPVVAGVYTAPIPLKMPKVPKTVKKWLPNGGEIVLRGVISQSGDFIDVSLPEGIQAELRDALMKLAAQYRFHPATRDGQPIATLADIHNKFPVW